MQELHFDEIFISVTPFLVELTSGHWDIFLEMIKITGKGGKRWRRCKGRGEVGEISTLNCESERLRKCQYCQGRGILTFSQDESFYKVL